jgi:dephospho-CoA kinase
MIILGLTGSMGMGKSTVTKMLRLVFHVPVWDADQGVRDLLATDLDLIAEIRTLYPEVMVLGKIDRSLLRSRAFEDEACLSTLERLIHERAFSLALQFLAKMRHLKVPLCVLDVPLLFEVGWDELCTHTAVIYAPPAIQQERLLRRADLNETRIQHILRRQWTSEEKRARATYEIQSGLSKRITFQQLDKIITEISKEKLQDA